MKITTAINVNYYFIYTIYAKYTHGHWALGIEHTQHAIHIYGG